MADARLLKKKISFSRRLAALKTDSARLLYTWLIPHLDVEGRFSADPDVVKGQVFPRLKHMTPDKIEALLLDLASQELIIRYSNDGDLFLQLRRFGDEQHLRKNREKASEIPSPDKCSIIDGLKELPGNCPATARQPSAQVKLREDKIRYNNKEATARQPPGKKKSYGEFVSLKEEEYQKLITQFGKKKTKKMLDILDNAKGAKGYKYKSDYRAILSWVVDKVNKGESDQDKTPRLACKKCGDSGRYINIDENGLCAHCSAKNF